MTEEINLKNNLSAGDIRIEWEGSYLIISPDYFEYDGQKIYKKDADVHKVYEIFLKLLKLD